MHTTSAGVPSLTRRALFAATGIGLVTAAASLVGCGSADANASSTAVSSEAGALKTVRIAVPGRDGTLAESARIAQTRGFLEEELRKVGYQPAYTGFVQAGPAINEGLAAGSIDLAEYADLPGYSAIAKGVAVKAFASTNSAGHGAIFASAASGVKDLAGLKGKKIAVGFGTASHHYLLQALASVNLMPKDVELVNAATDGATMVTAGQADAYASALFDVLNTAGKAKGTIIGSTQEHPEWASMFLFFYRADFNRENPKVAPAVVRALQRAYRLASTDSNAGYKALTSKMISEDMARKLYATGFDSLDPAITEDVKHKVETLGAFMKDNKLVSKTVSVDEYFDEQPLRQAQAD